jgi:hypothetical protein
MSESEAAAAARAAAGDNPNAAADAVFADLIGCSTVLAKLREWQATIKASQALGKDPLDSFELNFTFVGAPGECSKLLLCLGFNTTVSHHAAMMGC